MKPKSKVRATVWKGARPWQVWPAKAFAQEQDKEGHGSQTGDVILLILLILGILLGRETHLRCFTPNLQTKQWVPRGPALGVCRGGFGQGPFPAFCSTPSSQNWPQKWSCCTEGTCANICSFVSVLLILLFWIWARKPGRGRLLPDLPMQRGRWHLVTSPTVGSPSKR